MNPEQSSFHFCKKMYDAARALYPRHCPDMINGVGGREQEGREGNRRKQEGTRGNKREQEWTGGNRRGQEGSGGMERKWHIESRRWMMSL